MQRQGISGFSRAKVKSSALLNDLDTRESVPVCNRSTFANWQQVVSINFNTEGEIKPNTEGEIEPSYTTGIGRLEVVFTACMYKCSIHYLYMKI